jgi:hypothetical protein
MVMVMYYKVSERIIGEHDISNFGPTKGEKKDFLKDSEWRLDQMQKRTRGKEFTADPKMKKAYNTQAEFVAKFKSGNLIKIDGYQLIGDLVYVPTGTWANALRARTIVERDFKAGHLEKEPKFILLQYGGTLQVCSYKKMGEMELPVLKNGEVVNDLGKYMTNLLRNFQKHLGYHDPNTSIGQDEITVSGGHGGNVQVWCGRNYEHYVELNYDLVVNGKFEVHATETETKELFLTDLYRTAQKDSYREFQQLDHIYTSNRYRPLWHSCEKDYIVVNRTIYSE